MIYIIDKLKQKNDGSFFLIDAEDVEYNEQSLADVLASYKTGTELTVILSNYATTEDLEEAKTELQTYVNEQAAKLFVFQGSVSTYADLPTEPSIGDVYNIETADEDNDIAAGDNVVWTGDEWAKFGSSDIDLTGYATTTYVDEAVENKTTELISGENGEAYIQNDEAGGGAKFVHTDGTTSYVGVTDGGADGVAAQIYAQNESSNGAVLNVYQKGMFYHNAEDQASETYTADDADHEVATLGDIPTALTADEIEAICV